MPTSMKGAGFRKSEDRKVGHNPHKQKASRGNYPKRQFRKASHKKRLMNEKVISAMRKS